MICQCLADQLFASAFSFGKYIDLLAPDKSRYFAQPRPIIVKHSLAQNFRGLLLQKGQHFFLVMLIRAAKKLRQTTHLDPQHAHQVVLPACCAFGSSGDTAEEHPPIGYK